MMPRRPFLSLSVPFALLTGACLLPGCGEKTGIEIVYQGAPEGTDAGTGGQQDGPRIACLEKSNCPGAASECVDGFCVCEGPCDPSAIGTGGTSGDGDGDVAETGGVPGDGDGDALPVETGGSPGDGDGDATETGGMPGDGDGDNPGDGDGDGDGDAPAVANLIQNGDFEGGTTGWEGGDGAPALQDGQACREGGTFGWQGSGSGMNVPAGSYTFSFQLSGEGVDNVTVKVAGAVEPWEPILLEESITPSSAMMPYSYPINVENDAAQIGVAFVTSGGRSCLDDVALVKN